jgi:hypothetical protein
VKKGFTLKMPPYQFTPGVGGDCLIVSAKTWAGATLRERDRSILPVVAHRGFVNTVSGFAADKSPSPTFNVFVPFPPFFISVPRWIEPSPYWGKEGRLVKAPRAVLFAGLAQNGSFSPTPPMALLAASPTDMAALSDAGVFLGTIHVGGQAGSGGYNGIFCCAMPWTSAPSGSLGAGQTGPLPVITPSSFTGGDVLVIYLATGDYLSPTNVMETTLLNSDVAQVAAALGSLRSLRYRIYDQVRAAGVPDSAAIAAAAASGAGIDVSVTPGVVGGDWAYTLASLQNDYKTFFGI